jgi:hypothetical protein
MKVRVYDIIHDAVTQQATADYRLQALNKPMTCHLIAKGAHGRVLSIRPDWLDSCVGDLSRQGLRRWYLTG